LAEDVFQVRRELRQAMCLYAKNNHVGGPSFFKGTDDFGPHFETAAGTLYPHAVCLHSSEVRAAREERDIVAGFSHARADVGANRTRSCDEIFHSCVSVATRVFSSVVRAAATVRRRIFPVAVVGMLGTK